MVMWMGLGVEAQGEHLCLVRSTAHFQQEFTRNWLAFPPSKMPPKEIKRFGTLHVYTFSVLPHWALPKVKIHKLAPWSNHDRILGSACWIVSFSYPYPTIPSLPIASAKILFPRVGAGGIGMLSGGGGEYWLQVL